MLSADFLTRILADQVLVITDKDLHGSLLGQFPAFKTSLYHLIDMLSSSVYTQSRKRSF